MEAFFAAFLLSMALTVVTRTIARRWRVLDIPDSARRFHEHAVPLLGGVALFCSFWIILGIISYMTPTFLGINLLGRQLITAFFASLFLLIVGIADDVRGLGVGTRLGATVIAALAMALNGLTLVKLTNPFSHTPFAIGPIVSGALVFCWIMGITYATKISDGIDGLATGMVGIASVMIAAFAATTAFFQPNVSLIALIFAGAIFGFLVFNFYPASIFLGESGSLFLGFMIAVLSVLSGSKVATALLVLAVPVIDLARVMYVRRSRGQSIFQGDRLHLHYELLRYGLKEWQVVLLFYGAALLAGLLALFLQSAAKFLVFILFAIVLVAMTWRFTLLPKDAIK